MHQPVTLREASWAGRRGGRLQHTVQAWGDFVAHTVLHARPDGTLEVLDAFGGEGPQLCSDFVCSGDTVAWASRHSYDDDTDFQLHLFDLRRERHLAADRPLATFDRLVGIRAGPRTITATGISQDGRVVHVSHAARGGQGFAPVIFCGGR